GERGRKRHTTRRPEREGRRPAPQSQSGKDDTRRQKTDPRQKAALPEFYHIKRLRGKAVEVLRNKSGARPDDPRNQERDGETRCVEPLRCLSLAKTGKFGDQQIDRQADNKGKAAGVQHEGADFNRVHRATARIEASICFELILPISLVPLA